MVQKKIIISEKLNCIIQQPKDWLFEKYLVILQNPVPTNGQCVSGYFCLEILTEISEG